MNLHRFVFGNFSLSWVFVNKSLQHGAAVSSGALYLAQLLHLPKGKMRGKATE